MIHSQVVLRVKVYVDSKTGLCNNVCQPGLDLGSSKCLSSKIGAVMSLATVGWRRAVNGEWGQRDNCGVKFGAPHRIPLEKAVAKLFTVRRKWEKS